MNETSHSEAFSAKDQLQNLAKRLLFKPEGDIHETGEINLKSLSDLPYSNLKSQKRPVFLLSELCRLLIRLGDRASLGICMELSNKIYPFKCNKNESLTISHLYRGISQIGLKTTDLGIKNVAIGLSGQEAFSLVPEDRTLGFWALMSAAITKKNIRLALSFAEKWRKAAFDGEMTSEIFRSTAAILLFHLLEGDETDVSDNLDVLKTTASGEWRKTADYFDDWVRAINNNECLEFHDSMGVFETQPLFLGLDWRPHAPLEDPSAEVYSNDFSILCKIRRKLCNEHAIQQLSAAEVEKLSDVYKKWELSRPLWEFESRLKHSDRIKYYNASMTRLFGNRLFDRIVGDTPLDPNLAYHDQSVLLFMDVRKFTSLCEKCSPGEVFTVLNPIFKIMNEELEKAGGVILDFSGDCIAVIFNIFEDQRSGIGDILYYTVSSLKRIYLHNAMSLQTGQPEIRIGVGINKGPVAMGYVGGLERCHLTVMGSAINVAARLETASKTLPGEIIVSEYCFDGGAPDVWANPEAVNFTVRDLGPYDQMRNVSQPIRLFGVGPLIKYWVDFVPMGFVAVPESGVVYLDVGNANESGIIDHHFESETANSACELLVRNPELLLDHVKDLPPSRIEFRLHSSPDLDCAATLYAAQELMDIAPRTPILCKLAEYVSLVDQAKIPDPEWMSDSLYGVFQAHRLLVSKKLGPKMTDFKTLEAQVRVVDSAMYLMEASENKANFSSIFGERLEWFTEEKEFIRADMVRYKADIELRSHTYVARVNGRSNPVVGLWIDHPQSIFFRIWAWSDPGAPDENGYGFLALDLSEDEKNRFVIGVDPASGTDLNGLGQLLERHESEKRRELNKERPIHPIRYPSDNSDPWYFGQGHEYAVIDSPGRGTVLTAEEVRGIHEGWEGENNNLD